MNHPAPEIEANRAARKWSTSELVGRVLWSCCQPLFRYSPRLSWGWRVSLLRLFGARIGRHVQIHPSVRIFIPWNLEVGDWTAIGFDALLYNLGPLKIGSRVTISQRAHLCGGSHEFRDPAMPLLKLPVTVGDAVWICADSFIGPRIHIGEGAVIAARAVVVRDVNARTIAAGNPGTMVGTRDKVPSTPGEERHPESPSFS